MATIISHPAVPLAVGIALGRGVIPARLLALGLLCSILPDLDVLAFKLGIPYEAMLGHRGFSHSILFAILAAVAFRIVSKVGRERPWTTVLFLTFATISHGLLDALTNGGLGVGFFAPFSGRRYFIRIRSNAGTEQPSLAGALRAIAELPKLPYKRLK